MLPGANVPYGPGPLPPGCKLVLNRAGRLPADFDNDWDVDQEDFGVLQRCISGIGKRPRDGVHEIALWHRHLAGDSVGK